MFLYNERNELQAPLVLHQAFWKSNSKYSSTVAGCRREGQEARDGRTDSNRELQPV